MNFRAERVSNLIREELSLMIARELEFPGALVTITEVTIDKKLELARVNVSVIPKEKEKEALKILVKECGLLQHLLLKKINIKPMPRIEFQLDKGLENAAKVEKLLLEQ